MTLTDERRAWLDVNLTDSYIDPVAEYAVSGLGGAHPIAARSGVQRGLQFISHPTKTYGFIVRGAGATKVRFDLLVKDWRDATRWSSSVLEHVSHPAYLGIIGLGREALPFIKHQLVEDPSSEWFIALIAIVGFDVANGASSVTEAAQRWVDWLNDAGFDFESD